jgi:pimeloyl-ACP methyl ester carboxylesterase
MRAMQLTFLPGTMCDRRVWKPVWAELRDRFETHYVALETETTRAGIQKQIALAGGENGPLNLIGFSMGGYFALEYALEHPGRVASLVTISASAFGLTDAEIAERRKAIAYLSTHDYHGIAPARIAQFVHASRVDDPAVAGVMREMDRDLGKATLIAQLTQTTDRASLGPRLPELKIPVMLIGADGDNFSPPAVIQKMAEAIGDVRVSIAAQTGHMIPLERPAWLARQIEDFYG